MFDQDALDGGMIGLGGGSAEGKRHGAEAQFEEPVAAPRLAVIIALRRGTRDDLDLPVIEPEAAIDGGDLRFDGALIRQKDARRTAFHDGRRDLAVIDVGEGLGGEDDRGILFA